MKVLCVLGCLVLAAPALGQTPATQKPEPATKKPAVTKPAEKPAPKPAAKPKAKPAATKKPPVLVTVPARLKIGPALIDTPIPEPWQPPARNPR